MANNSIVTHFLLMSFPEVQELQNIPFVVFLIIYLTALMWNLLIIAVVILNEHLHKPMHFFVLNLSVVDLGYISVTIPKVMANSIMKTRWILYSHCVAQLFFFVLFGASEFLLLTVMAYDRYVAICYPLHYEMMINRGSCIGMAGFAWMLGVLTATLYAGATFASPFCSNIIHQFFCEIPTLLMLSCSDMYLIEVGAIVLTGCLYFGCILFILITYVQIFKAVMRIPSAQGRQKAFSTCLPHLIVLSMFYFFGVFAYFRPTNRTPSQLDLVAAVAYCVVPPFLNPIIYSMRNKDIKGGMWKLIDWRYSSKTVFCFTYKSNFSR
ncbi:olfactory receptor 14I1-like [Hemicordylus capensis]|uniref:olfactory receptor 14I1-like n=1 Tax=Hemicordylus capensis TaxID=884348 RepID=UPI0023048E2D|nr:olfactory receptor 14I1-like [Hemicordylus capensis]